MEMVISLKQTNKNSQKIYKQGYINIIYDRIKITFKKMGKEFWYSVPMEKIKEENFSENEIVRIFIAKKRNPLKETFGVFKFKRPIKEILDEGDKESWDE